jgi:hypothetical protein
MIHGLQIVSGLGLGLLGLLDIGAKRITLNGSQGLDHGLNPLYMLLLAKMPLVIVLGVYGLVSTGGTLVERVAWTRKFCLR